MSVKKFKVGDKVRVRKGIDLLRCYRHSYRRLLLSGYAGFTLTIEKVDGDYYYVKENNIPWKHEYLEPVEKTLENLEKGDLIEKRNGDTKKVLAVLDGCYLLSLALNHQRTDCWYTAHELEDDGWKPIQPEEPSPETIEIGGKKYNKQEFEEAVKNLEPVD